MALAFQGTLFGCETPRVDRSFTGTGRRMLAGGAWIEHTPAWLVGADAVFGQIVDAVSWQSPMVTMWEKRMQTPRLNGLLPEPARPEIVEDMRAALSERYDIEFMSVGANLYRDGRDSVAWHGDRVARTLPDATICIVSLGGPRRFLLRPKSGGHSVRYELASGDLLVMGGSCQRTWQHSVPKVAHASPRISLTFRHKYAD